MAICTIIGTVRSISGANLSGATLKFERATLTGQDGSVVTRSAVRVTTDAQGRVSVDLYSGIYRLTVIPAGQGELSGQRGITTITVPDTASADLSDLMEQTPALTPTAVTEVRALRDECRALYDAWVAAGGADGADGASAYEVAVAAGFVGTEAEWLASLVGPQGEAGADGADGASAYEVAVAAGFVGTEAEWLASLVGPQGAAGADGADGASAYEVAVAAGFVGTEAEWLASLVGPQGEAGADGADGADGQSVTILTYTDEAAYNAAVTANAANPLVLVVRYASA